MASRTILRGVKARNRGKRGSLLGPALITVICFLSTGCASGFVTISPQVPEKFEKLGPARGSACGMLLLDIPFVCGAACAVIPAGLNDRVERAYNAALDSVPGSKALINVTLQEDHYWWVVGDAQCVTITGEAIR